MLASFLHCHSNTETLNLTVCEFRQEGGEGLMRGIKIPPRDFVLKMQGGGGGGGLMREGGRICWTTVLMDYIRQFIYNAF